MATVTIIRGFSRGQFIHNQTFTLLKGLQKCKSGKQHVTVDGMALYGIPSARIKVKSEKDFVIDGELPVDEKIEKTPKTEKAQTARQIAAASKNNEAVSLLEDTTIPDIESNETDEEVVTRISDRFSVLNKLTLGARRGDIRALFVTGAPGVGKTFGVEQTLAEANMIEQFEGSKKRYEIVSGACSALGLFMKLYEYSSENDVLVFDDCDMVFQDETALNLMKSALDTSAKRRIYWNLASKLLDKKDIPNDFDFKGSIIFISNINFRKVRGEKMRAHLSALMSRSFFLDLTVSTFREKMLRIEDLVSNKGMLDQFRLSAKCSREIMAFLRENATKFNELSLRTVIKLACVAKTFDEDATEWKKVAVMSLCGNPLSY
jgi:hypothetical protein